jgi:hypothetical protein
LVGFSGLGVAGREAFFEHFEQHCECETGCVVAGWVRAPIAVVLHAGACAGNNAAIKRNVRTLRTGTSVGFQFTVLAPEHRNKPIRAARGAIESAAREYLPRSGRHITLISALFLRFYSGPTHMSALAPPVSAPTDQQRSAYARDGYIVVRGLFAPAEMALAAMEAERLLGATT